MSYHLSMSSPPTETKILRLVVVVLAVIAGGLGWVIWRGDQALSALNEGQIESVIAAYLQDHPEVVWTALENAQKKVEQQKAQQTASNLVDLKSKIFDNAADPFLGNANGDVTLVEFFDYRCPYCKRVAPDIDALISEDSKIKVVLKEFPILGPESVYAAKLALAAQRQGQYEQMHRALMAHRGDYTEAVLLDLAKNIGLDLDRLKIDVTDPSIAGAVEGNLDLGRSIGIGGTPAFVIGRKVVPGAISVDELKQLVVEARRESS